MSKSLCGIGFNGSILRLPSGNYIGLIRRDTPINKDGVYPQGHSTIYFIELSSVFDVIQCKLLEDTLDRLRHTSWSSGLEDPRIITSKSCLCVTLDTNTEWKAEMSYVEFDSEKGSITKIQPLKIENLPRKIEKNWIVLEHEGIDATILYSTSPLIILKVNLDSGIGSILYEDPGIPFHAHNGSSVRLDDGSFLLSVRVKDGIHYKQSFWIKMRRDYTIESISKPYRFSTNEFRDEYTDREVYEMCMSMHIENGNIIASVGMNDTHVTIYMICLSDILEGLRTI